MRINFKLLIYLLIILLFTSNSYAVKIFKKGKGPLNISENTAHVLEYYFSGGTKGKWADPEKADWNPYVIAISEDGHYFGFIRQPKKFAPGNVDEKNYSALAVGDCKKMAKEDGYPQDCFLFAVRTKIVWNNGSDKKRRRLKKSEIKAGKTFSILKELDFYKGTSQKLNTKKNNNSSSNNNTNSTNSELVEQIKSLKKLYDDGVLSKEEFEKAKKKILN